jgi:hypothetical protein
MRNVVLAYHGNIAANELAKISHNAKNAKAEDGEKGKWLSDGHNVQIRTKSHKLFLMKIIFEIIIQRERLGARLCNSMKYKAEERL